MSIAQSLLTIDEAADKLRMSDKQLRAHVRAGNIAFVNIGLCARRWTRRPLWQVPLKIPQPPSKSDVRRDNLMAFADQSFSLEGCCSTIELHPRRRHNARIFLPFPPMKRKRPGERILEQNATKRRFAGQKSR